MTTPQAPERHVGSDSKSEPLVVEDGDTGTITSGGRRNADLLTGVIDPDGDTTFTISAVNGDTASVGKAVDPTRVVSNIPDFDTATTKAANSPSTPMAPGASTEAPTINNN